MKSILSFLTFLLLTTLAFAQVPQAFNYQAVARDANGDCISNQQIAIQIKLLDSLITGPVIYTEIHSVMTNQQGLFSLEIGRGQVQAGVFNELADIPWGSSAKFLQVEMDPNGGFNFQVVGTSELLSMPYAMYAERTYIPHASDSAASATLSTLRNQWLTDAGVEVAVPESGVYHISASGRAWAMSNANGEWARFRVFNVTAGTEVAIGFIGHVESGSGDQGNGDQTGTVFSIAPLQAGDVLRLEFWIRSAVAIGGQARYGGDQNGRSSLSILKVGS